MAANWLTRLRLSLGESPQVISLEHERGLERERARLGDTVAPGVALAVDRLATARLLQSLGRHGEALCLLEEAAQAAETAGRTGALLEILALRASVLWARGEKERAVGTLARALALAEPEGFTRTFVDEGAEMGDLLPDVLKARRRSDLDVADGVSAQYLARLMDASAQGSVSPADERLPELLSERELEVLALNATGKSNREIATELVVSEGTVKTHAKHIFRKLGAHSRTQALAQARELGLL